MLRSSRRSTESPAIARRRVVLSGLLAITCLIFNGGCGTMSSAGLTVQSEELHTHPEFSAHHGGSRIRQGGQYDRGSNTAAK